MKRRRGSDAGLPVVPPTESVWLSGFRRGIRWGLIALALAFAVHILIPAAGNVGLVVDTIASASWAWMAVAALMSAGTYLFAAMGMRVAVDPTAPLARVAAAQVASTAALLFAPAGLGGLALNERFFQRRGIRDSVVVAGLMLNTVVTAAIHVCGVVALALALGFRFPQSVHAPGLTALQWTVVAAVVGGLAIWLTAQRRRVLAPILDTLRSIPVLIRDRNRVAGIGLAAVAVNGAYVAALQASLAAFGPVPDIWHTALAYLVGVTIGTVMPTPAGIGGTEAGLVAVLTRVGVAQGQAVAATLSFRLVTFWIPILPGLALAGVLRRRHAL